MAKGGCPEQFTRHFGRSESSSNTLPDGLYAGSCRRGGTPRRCRLNARGQRNLHPRHNGLVWPTRCTVREYSPNDASEVLKPLEVGVSRTLGSQRAYTMPSHIATRRTVEKASMPMNVM